jgi:integration host factor subunit alpha
MVKTINKENIAESISNEVGISRSQSQEMVNDIIGFMTQIIETEDKLRVKYFGSFQKHKKNQRIGRNPKTKEEHVIAARELITFKASDIFKQYINDNKND